jgi:long-chain acyl-CoA synthetase
VEIIEGEICVRGESVSAGYYKDPEATAAAFRDGWFHTGDLGHFDEDGFLYYDGRCKNLIVLSNGENVSPEALEHRLYRVEGILDAVVYEKNGCITAEVWADPNVFPDRESLWRAISRVNRTVSAFQQIGEVVLRTEPFDKTATQKIKRYETGKEKS